MRRERKRASKRARARTHCECGTSRVALKWLSAPKLTQDEDHGRLEGGCGGSRGGLWLFAEEEIHWDSGCRQGTQSDEVALMEESGKWFLGHLPLPIFTFGCTHLKLYLYHALEKWLRWFAARSKHSRRWRVCAISACGTRNTHAPSYRDCKNPNESA
jgi:hypothetical protein